MNPLPKKKLIVTESDIQTGLINRYTIDGWYCIRTHGNKYQAGFPDVYMCSRKYGYRWVEVKREKNYKFTQAQINVFTRFGRNNVGIWVLTDNNDFERKKIFYPANWHTYLPPRITIHETIDRQPKVGPEGRIQNAIIHKLTEQGWFCIETYGSIYQSGLPDIYCIHKRFGVRWIECKNPDGYKFTPAQVYVFPRVSAEGIGIWILTNVDDTDLLFKPPNWHRYLYK